MAPLQWFRNYWLFFFICITLSTIKVNVDRFLESAFSCEYQAISLFRKISKRWLTVSENTSLAILRINRFAT